MIVSSFRRFTHYRVATSEQDELRLQALGAALQGFVEAGAIFRLEQPLSRGLPGELITVEPLNGHENYHAIS